MSPGLLPFLLSAQSKTSTRTSVDSINYPTSIFLHLCSVVRVRRTETTGPAGATLTRKSARRWPVATGPLLRARRPPGHPVSASMASDSGHKDETTCKKHLVVLQHGLFGHPLDWKSVVDALHSELGCEAEAVLVHTTEANTRQRSMAGIDVCGQRVADEILQIASEHPSLEHLSLVGLSLGGIICRYVAAVLLDQQTGLMAGLKPGLYVSIASPHLGMSSEKGDLHAAGFYEWTEMHHNMHVGARMFHFAHRLLIWVTKPLPRPVLNRTAGRSTVQLFHLDADRGGYPLIEQMTRDGAVTGLPFISALAAFQARTAYANHVGDQWISWPSGSIRATAELPTIDTSSDQPCVIQVDSSHPPRAVTDTPKAESAAATDDPPVATSSISLTSLNEQEQSMCGECEEIAWDVNRMLHRLQALEWTRVDVSFYNAPGEAARASHDLIIQGLPVRNAKFVATGDPSVKHIATHIASFLRQAPQMPSS